MYCHDSLPILWVVTLFPKGPEHHLTLGIHYYSVSYIGKSDFYPLLWLLAFTLTLVIYLSKNNFIPSGKTIVTSFFVLRKDLFRCFQNIYFHFGKKAKVGNILLFAAILLGTLRNVNIISSFITGKLYGSQLYIAEYKHRTFNHAEKDVCKNGFSGLHKRKLIFPLFSLAFLSSKVVIFTKRKNH